MADSMTMVYWLGEPIEVSMGVAVTNQGVITIALNHGVRVDITKDKAIRMVNNQTQAILALSANGSSAAMIHPTGRVYQYGSRVETCTSADRGNSKQAKMWFKGVSFTSEQSALIYLVDQAGARTTTDQFSDMSGDFTLPVFLLESSFGAEHVNECVRLLQSTQYWITEEGVENWVINGIRISQTVDGLARVGRGTSKYQLRTSPTTGTASITTPFVHCTASIGTAGSGGNSGPHLFVKRGERRMHCDGQSFIVRNAGHSAGFDEKSQLKVF